MEKLYTQIFGCIILTIIYGNEQWLLIKVIEIKDFFTIALAVQNANIVI